MKTLIMILAGVAAFAMGAFGSWAPGAVGLAVLLSLVLAIEDLRRSLLVYATPFCAILLATLGYGANNIGLAGVPVFYFLLPVLLVNVQWSKIELPKVVLIAYSILLVVTVGRLMVDLPRFGSTAVRDSLVVFDLLYFVPVVDWARRVGPEKAARLVDVLMKLVAIWAVASLARGSIAPVFPTVGLYQPVSLADFTAAGLLSGLSFLYFIFAAKGSRQGLWAIVSFMAILIAQFKGVYVAVLLVFALSFLMGRGAAASSLKGVLRLLIVALLGLAVLSYMPALPSRVGSLGVDTLTTQLGELQGGSGPGSASIDRRDQWREATVQLILSTPSTFVLGAGLGSDLVQGFTSAEGTPVRKPHNDPLEMFGRLGAAGFLSALVVLAGIYKQIASPADPSRSRDGRFAAMAILYSLIISTTQPFFAFAYGTWPILFIVGVGYAACRADNVVGLRESVRAEERSGRSVRVRAM